MADGIRTTNRLIWITTTVVFGLLGLVLGAQLGRFYVKYAKQERIAVLDHITEPVVLLVLALGMAIVMARIGSWLADRMITSLGRFHTMSLADRVLTVMGVLLGVLFGVLITLALPDAPSWWLSVKLAVIVVAMIVGLVVFQGLRADMLRVFPQLEEEDQIVGASATPKLLDTNVIIDGRMAELCKTGFVEGPIWVPRFVLEEVQYIADSADAMRRGRGRRGLEILNMMRQQTVTRTVNGKVETVPMVRVLNDIPPQVQKVNAVDSKLVALAHEMNAAIITNDFNLNRVAELQEIKVLNLNELAGALKPVVLPGEEMNLSIVREGKEPNQGVGYLDDGTMVVVGDGGRHIGETCAVVISSVYQTVAGKMIFAEMKEIKGAGDDLFKDDTNGKRDGGRDTNRDTGNNYAGRPGSGMRRKSRP